MIGALRQKVGLALVLGCLAGVAACNSGSEITDTSPVTEPAPTETPSDPSEDVVEEPATPEPTASSTTTTTPDKPEVQAAKPGAVSPGNARPSPLPAECSNPQDQQAMNRCSRAIYERADAELNTAYQSVRGSVDTQKASQLQSAEEAWLVFRDAYCEFVQTQFEGGSVQPTVYHGCLTLLTQDRTDALKQADETTEGYEAVDANLNSVYQQLQSYLTAQEQDLLVDAQLAWIEYRDLHCAFEAGDTNACLAAVTQTRVNQLQEQLDVRSL